MTDVCPICNGEGKRIKVLRSFHTGLMKPVTEWCLCSKSKFVSNTYELLRPLGDIYLPLEKIDKRMFLDLKDLSKSPNLYITSTSMETFLLHVKSVIIKYRFLNNPPSIYLCQSIEILQKFFVQQEDKSQTRLTDMNKYELVVFTLDTKQKNDHLGTCISQVVYNRYHSDKPTWVYLPESTVLENIREYTDDLKKFLSPVITGDSESEISEKIKSKRYKKISIADVGMKIKEIRSEAQNAASKFSPFS